MMNKGPIRNTGWLPVVAVALTMATSAVFISGCSNNADSSANHKSSSDIKQRLSASGEIISLDTANISPPSVRGMWQMKVQYMVPENSHVKEGDVLVKFDAQQLNTKVIGQQSELSAEQKKYETEQLEAEAKAEELKLALAEAEMNYDKAKRLAEIVDASTKQIDKDKQQKQFEIAAAKLVKAKRQLAQFATSRELQQQLALKKINRLQLKLNQTKSDIEKLAVTSPKAGLIMYKASGDGEKVAVGDTVWMGRSLMTIPSLDKLAVQAQFDEADTAKLALGSRVKITLDAYPEVPYTGTIRSLGQAYKAKSRSNLSVVFDVEIDLENIDLERMRPGMKANVEVQEVVL